MLPSFYVGDLGCCKMIALSVVFLAWRKISDDLWSHLHCRRRPFDCSNCGFLYGHRNEGELRQGFQNLLDNFVDEPEMRVKKNSMPFRLCLGLRRFWSNVRKVSLPKPRSSNINTSRNPRVGTMQEPMWHASWVQVDAKMPHDSFVSELPSMLETLML